MIVVKLREAMIEYERRTGKRITYEGLAELSGLAESTLRAIATRPGYNTTMRTVDTLCAVLEVALCDLVERRPDLDRKKAARRRAAGSGKEKGKKSRRA